MFEEKLKQNYIKALNEMELDQELKGLMVSFIETYDGSNTEEFNLFLLNLLGLLSVQNRLNIKASAYDKIATSNQVFTNKAFMLTEEADIVKGKSEKKLVPNIPLQPKK